MSGKKLAAAALALFISVFCFPTAVNANASKGDTNGDGKINVRDAAFIASSIATGRNLGSEADYNCDGKKNIRDAAALVNDLTGGSVSAQKKASYDEKAEEMLSLINEERAAVGAAPLQLNSTLINISNVRASEIVDVFSHTRPDGRACSTVFDDNGIYYTYSGENIAAGTSTVKDTFDYLKESKGHYENMVNGNYTNMGVAFVYNENSYYKYYWVQVFYAD